MRFSSWGSRLSFYLAVMGTAFGLGNLWRFPYIVADNGGGAFVLLYVSLALLIGIPLIIGELMLGKLTRKSVVSGISSIRSSIQHKVDSGELKVPAYLRWSLPFIGYFSLAICIAILSYFSVISGWVLYYFVKFATKIFDPTNFDPQIILNFLMQNGWMQVLLTSVHLLLVIVIVAKDVEEGLEKFVGYIMPLFVFLLLALMVQSLRLDSTAQAMRFLFYPDFTKLTLASLSQALGHMLFTLSLGFGMTVTFGSYLREKSYIPNTGFRVASLDSLMSIVAGMLIFPLIMLPINYGVGPDLLFQTVPSFFNSIPSGGVYGMVFFLFLYLGALGASVGLLEAVVSNFKETDKIPRPKAAWSAGAICFALAFVPALSSSLLSRYGFFGESLLELLDSLLVDWLLPLAALLISQVVYYCISHKQKEAEFFEKGVPTSLQTFRHWKIAVKWVIPSITLLAIALRILGLVI